MKTGIVVNNYDPLFKNRCQVRVQGLHTQKVCGKYVIIDDDLPWAIPAPQTSSFGGSSVPDVGSTVYIDVKDKFNLTYYGQVEVKGGIKGIMHNNADSSDKVKVIAYSDDVFNGNKVELRMMYIPDDGLSIKCNGHSIFLSNGDNINIVTNSGSSIIMNGDKVEIHSPKTINLNCDSVNITDKAAEKIILGSNLMEKFNNHTHLCPLGITTEPLLKIEENDFSDKIRIS